MKYSKTNRVAEGRAHTRPVRGKGGDANGRLDRFDKLCHIDFCDIEFH